ncbi:MAG: hypothetical protein CMJ46_01820 [Planctomyces sp.]|nr:hypothetical protein [Planctomyces sp.]
MLHLLSVFAPILLIFVGMVPLLFLGLWGDIKKKKRKGENAATQDLLRSPGYSLRERIGELNDELMYYMMWMVMLPVLAYATVVSRAYWAGSGLIAFEAVLVTFSAIAGMVVLGRRLSRIMEDLQRKRLGMEGELATGEELNLLMLEGCRVFHDIQTANGNIDHIVVAPGGVFSINTKSWWKPKEGPDRAKVRVDFGDGTLRFADGRVKDIPYPQLNAEARWLATQLTGAVGKPVSVKPVLALTGSFLEGKTRSPELDVINPKNCRGFFLERPVVLTQEDIGQIVYQLEQRARDIPLSFKEPRRW